MSRIKELKGEVSSTLKPWIPNFLIPSGVTTRKGGNMRRWEARLADLLTLLRGGGIPLILLHI